MNEFYYDNDHMGRTWLRRIISYGLRPELIESEQDLIADYYEYALELIESETLHLQENKNWAELNFRGGWHAVKGFLAEVLAVIIWNYNNSLTKFRLAHTSKDEQVKGKDLIATNPNWRNDYVVQVKTLVRGNDPKQMYVDPKRITCYDPDYVDRLVFVDIDNLVLYHFDYKEFLDHYEKCEKYVGDYIDDNFWHLKHFHKLSI